MSDPASMAYLYDSKERLIFCRTQVFLKKYFGSYVKITSRKPVYAIALA